MIKKLVIDNLGWKLLSLGLAAVLWIFVAREPELATSVSAPIEYENVPAGIDIGPDMPDRIHLEVRGPAGRLTPAWLAPVAVVLDLSRVHGPGERTFNVSESFANLPPGVTVYRAVPSQVRIAFEQTITREVPVKPRYAGGPPSGYHILSYQMQPAVVKVTGPENRVRRIEFVQTDPVDLSGVVGMTERRLRIFVGDPQVRLTSAVSVTYRVSLQKDVSDVIKKAKE